MTWKQDTVTVTGEQKKLTQNKRYLWKTKQIKVQIPKTKKPENWTFSNSGPQIPFKHRLLKAPNFS